MTDSGEPPAASRRKVLDGIAATVACGAATVLVGCGRSQNGAAKKGTAAAVADAQLLNELLGLEHWAIAAYTAAAPVLIAPDARRAARWFLGQELAHASELTKLVHQAGGKASTPASSYRFGDARGGDALLRFLHRIESAQLAAYLRAIPLLTPGPLRAAAATIFANDAQHLSILRSALGWPPLPDAFASGRE